MAYSGGIKFKDPERKNFAIKDFTGGICNTKSPLKLSDNQCFDMLNVSFELDGVLKKRSGIRNSEEVMGDTVSEDVLNTFVIEATPNKYGYLINTNTSLIYFVANKSGHSDADRKFISWNRANTEQPIQGVQFLDRFFFVDGGDMVHYFNIKDLETMEEPPIYYITNPPDNFTPLPKPSVAGVVKQEDYPVNTGYPAKKIWYEPCQAELEDGYKGACRNVYPKTLIQVHGDRLYVSGNHADPNMVYISDVLNPHYFPASLPIQTPPVGDVITSLHVFMDTLVIGRRDSVYCLYGNTNRTDAGIAYTLKHLNTHTGMPNANCANRIHNYLFYVGTDGQCYKLSTTQTDATQLITSKTNGNFDFTLPPLNKSVDSIRMCHTGFDPVKGEWYVQIGEDTAVYNYNLMSWTRYNNLDNVKFITIDNKFYIVRRDNTFNIFCDECNYDTYQYDTYTSVPIECYWKSKTIDFGAPTRIKQIRDTYIVSESYEKYVSDVQINYKVDYIDVKKKQSIVNEIPLWNVALWDRFKFVSNNIVRSLPIMVGRRGRTFEIEVRTPYRFKGVYNYVPMNGENFIVGDIIQIRSGLDESIIGYWIRTEYDLETGEWWKEIPSIEYYFQPMKVYELSGIYELRGNR